MVNRYRLILLALGLLLTTACEKQPDQPDNVVEHSQDIKVECEKLGYSLNAFLISKAIVENKKPALQAPLDSLHQYDSSHNRKLLEPALTGDEIVACFGDQGRELYFLRNSIQDQRNRLRTDKEENKLRLRIAQITIIVLGAIATLLLGLGDDKWKTLAIIPTVLVTVVASLVALEDYRREVTRTAKAESDLSKLNTEIEIALLKAATRGKEQPPPFKIERPQLEGWWVRADGIIKGVDDDWLSRFSKEEKPK